MRPGPGPTGEDGTVQARAKPVVPPRHRGGVGGYCVEMDEPHIRASDPERDQFAERLGEACAHGG